MITRARQRGGDVLLSGYCRPSVRSTRHRANSPSRTIAVARRHSHDAARDERTVIEHLTDGRHVDVRLTREKLSALWRHSVCRSIFVSAKNGNRFISFFLHSTTPFPRVLRLFYPHGSFSFVVRRIVRQSLSAGHVR